MKDFLKDTVRGFLYGLRNILDPICKFEEVSVLAYHSLSASPADTALLPHAFREQLSYLQRRGFSFVTLEDICAWHDGAVGKKLPRKAVAITFDDGYADFETTTLPILREFKAPCTLFVIGDTASESGLLKVHAYLQNDIPLLTPEALERVTKDSLVEIGFHSRSHANLAKLGGAELREEIKIQIVEGISSAIRYFAYPGGNYSNEAIAETEKAGYSAAFSIKRRLVQKTTNPYLYPRTVVTKDMKTWLVGMHTTKAIDWYRNFTRLLRA